MRIYKATCQLNNKSYIGLESGRRWNRRTVHLHKAKNNSDNSYFHNAIRKYGESSFKWIILADDIGNRRELETTEIYYIAKFNTFGAGGYNMTSGGEGTAGGYTPKGRDSWHYGKKLPQEQRKKISESNKGKHKPSPEHLAILKATHLGKKRSLESRAKQSLSNTGKKASNETKNKMSRSHMGHIVTKETREKMSKAQLGRKQETIECPHCGLVGSIRNLKVYHFDNCKEITE